MDIDENENKLQNNFRCQFCNSNFVSQKNLDGHLKNAKYCLNIQGKNHESHRCYACNKSFSTKHWLVHHQVACVDYIVSEKTKIFRETAERLIDENTNLREMIKEILKCIKIGDRVEIDQIERKIYPVRDKYPPNVIYILTTNDMSSKGEYIFGKTKCLTNRLSTYNKTCDHIVVYYKECELEYMDLIEKTVFKKLDAYRPDKNRERFVLPDDESIDLFKNVIDECVKFFCS